MAQLYDETSHLVYSLAVRMVGNTPDAEEVTVDVFSQAWRSAVKYSADRGTVFGWLMNMTRSRAIDCLRGRRNRSRSSEPLTDVHVPRDTSANPERRSQMTQEREHVQRALAQLPPDQRTAIELAFFSGLSHSELAEHLGEPLGTVKTRIRSGMLKLRTSLGALA